MSAVRYTGVPDADLAALLDRTLAELSAEIDALRLPCLQAVVLGGGYGRGEGGVLHTPSGGRLYNDLDFFVFSRGADPGAAARIDSALKEISGRYGKTLHIAVDFGPVKNVETLRRVASTLMFQELLRGWVPVWGQAELERWIPALDPSCLPFSEAVRLLLNRGMGLVFAGEYLKNRRNDPDFIVRNMNKAVLGSGDALLIASGDYQWRGRDRARAFAECVRRGNLPPEWASLYEKAFQWKLEPEPVLPEDPRRVWLDCRRFYLDGVCRCAGVPAGSSADRVTAGLHRHVKRERSLKNLLRWLLRAHRLPSAALIFDPPVVPVLGKLYAELCGSETYPDCPSHLYRAWELFN